MKRPPHPPTLSYCKNCRREFYHRRNAMLGDEIEFCNDCLHDEGCDVGIKVFDNCNVCGRKLHGEDEEAMGMCQGCADE